MIPPLPRSTHQSPRRTTGNRPTPRTAGEQTRKVRRRWHRRQRAPALPKSARLFRAQRVRRGSTGPASSLQTAPAPGITASGSMNIATILPGGSVRARNLTVMLFTVALAAESSRIKRFKSSRSLPGRIITSTPAKPMTIALQRRSRTSSCRTNTAAIVAKRGAVKLTAVAIANGTTVIPWN